MRGCEALCARPPAGRGLTEPLRARLGAGLGPRCVRAPSPRPGARLRAAVWKLAPARPGLAAPRLSVRAAPGLGACRPGCRVLVRAVRPGRAALSLPAPSNLNHAGLPARLGRRGPRAAGRAPSRAVGECEARTGLGVLGPVKPGDPRAPLPGGAAGAD